ncbi:glycosyltransferase family 1 protein [Mesobacillus sp. AQ2]|uniref:glycosyltransferase family 1 protein n=1 Tax=Mesobacillus sp. AQ2 TaxID=3043332 RepID=UPI0024C1F111|nr:glycosyltransferase family 1 protein [Mesobacillus sp. AQ2]WHX42844.1 glycosyltransferase family 1 protein [Mesobacillus sp. AQ2]
MDRGGAETLLMNVYRNLDRCKLQFDFIVHRDDQGDYDNEIQKLGGKIYRVPSLGNAGPISYVKKLAEIMSSNLYIAVHSHTDYQSGFPALAAKIAGIPHRICHSHSNNWPMINSFKQKLVLKGLQSIIKISATQYCSCSQEAGAFLFGQKAVDENQVTILKNGIDLGQYLDETITKTSVIRELGLEQDAKIIGHVGKFSRSKNQAFILQVLKQLVKKDKKYVALLVGDGPLKENIEQEAENMGLSKHVRFLGVRSDIPRLMKAFDVFLFPSIFEGFGIVTVEAQISGTPCILSNSVPISTDMGLGLVRYLSLGERPDKWGEEVEKAIHIKKPERDTLVKALSEKGFSIQQNIEEWMKLYRVG